MRILEQGETQIFNFDGIVENYISAQYRNGIIKGVLNECDITHTVNTITIDLGYMTIKGVRVVIDTAYTITIPTYPTDPESRQVVLKLTFTKNTISDIAIAAEILNRQTVTLTQDDILKEQSGTYEIELCNYILTSSGISTLTKTINVLQ